jgi:hypothetical protein
VIQGCGRVHIEYHSREQNAVMELDKAVNHRALPRNHAPHTQSHWDCSSSTIIMENNCLFILGSQNPIILPLAPGPGPPPPPVAPFIPQTQAEARDHVMSRRGSSEWGAAQNTPRNTEHGTPFTESSFPPKVFMSCFHVHEMTPDNA